MLVCCKSVNPQGTGTSDRHPTDMPIHIRFDRNRTISWERSGTIEMGRTSAGSLMPANSFTWSGLNEGFVVAIHIEAKQGEAETVARLLADLVAPTMAEPGVKLFLPYRSPTSPALFLIFELYKDAEEVGCPSKDRAFQGMHQGAVARPWLADRGDECLDVGVAAYQRENSSRRGD
jgi:quinol monooxygenase YgiN